MRRTIDNGFELTGPIARGDWATVDAHLAAIHQSAPDLEAAVPRAGAGDTAVKTLRTVADLRRALAPPPRARDDRARADHGGAARRDTSRCFDAARRKRDVVVASLFVNPTPVRRSGRSRRAIRATRPRTSASPQRRASTFCFAPAVDEMYPAGFATWVEVDGAGSGSRRRVPPGPLPRRRHGLREALQHRRARTSRSSDRRTRSRWP